MATLQLQLVTPERTLLNEVVESVSVTTIDGQITILPHHAPLVATLVSGEATIRSGRDARNLHVGGGFIHVGSDNTVRILSDAAEHDYEIDLARAEQAKAEAETALREQTLSDEEYATTAALLQRNLSRIAIAKKHSHRGTRITSEGVFHSE